MAEWLGRVSHEHGMYCHDLEVTKFGPGWAKLEVRSTFVQVVLEPKTFIFSV